MVTDYTLHGKNIVHMKTGSDELHFFYDAQNKPAVVVYNGTAYSYVKNLQGDIVAILDSTGVVVVAYTYDAWGKPIATTGSMATTLGALNPFAYRAYIVDRETQCYYLRSRYYVSDICKFLNADCICCVSRRFLYSNLYTYCTNDCINLVDICGTNPNSPRVAMKAIAPSAYRPYAPDTTSSIAPQTINASRDWGYSNNTTMPLIDDYYHVHTIDKATAKALTEALYENASKAEDHVSDIMSGLGGINWVGGQRSGLPSFLGRLGSGLLDQATVSCYVEDQDYMVSVGLYDAGEDAGNTVVVLVKVTSEYDSALNTDWNVYDCVTRDAINFDEIVQNVMCLDYLQ